MTSASAATMVREESSLTMDLNSMPIAQGQSVTNLKESRNSWRAPTQEDQFPYDLSSFCIQPNENQGLAQKSPL
jgi:hypothetical protein